MLENDRESGSSNYNNKSHNNYEKSSHSHASSPRSGMPHVLDPSLLNKLLPIIKDWTKFSGEGEYDHINFIKYIEHIIKVYKAPDEAILTRLSHLFEGLDLDWFINKQEGVVYKDWPTWKELITAQFGTRMWEKKMRKAFENDFFDPIKNSPHQLCFTQKKRIDCIYKDLNPEEINEKILNQCKGNLEHNIRCRINNMDCDLSHLIGVMEEVVEMTGANKK